jgi:hypothetical protein
MRVKKWRTTALKLKPPWEREEFHYEEAPAVIWYLYALKMEASTIKRWIKSGRISAAGPHKGNRVRLNATRRLGKLYIRMIDLKAFCENT